MTGGFCPDCGNLLTFDDGLPYCPFEEAYKAEAYEEDE